MDQSKNQSYDNKLGLAVSGGAFITFAAGAEFSIQLVQIGFFILLAATVIVFHHVTTLIRWSERNSEKKETPYVMGITGGLLLFLFLGIQSPHVPFRPIVALIGVVLLVPWVVRQF